MRMVSLLILLSAAADRSFAHTLPDEHGVLEQLTHQLVDLHHLPNLWLLFAALLIVIQVWKSRTSPDN